MPIRILLLAFIFSLGCASKTTKAETKVSETKVEQAEPVDLKTCPCGRSDWDNPPPGHKKAPK